MGRLKFEHDEIVKYNKTGEIGILIQVTKSEGSRMHFYPSTMRMYDLNQLPVVTRIDVTETNTEQKIMYLRARNTKGYIKEIFEFNDGEYIIFKIEHKIEPKVTLFHIYLNFKNKSKAYYTLDSAIIGLLEYKYQGNNSQAGMMFERMLQMSQPNESGI